MTDKAYCNDCIHYVVRSYPCVKGENYYWAAVCLMAAEDTYQRKNANFTEWPSEKNANNDCGDYSTNFWRWLTNKVWVFICGTWRER